MRIAEIIAHKFISLNISVDVVYMFVYQVHVTCCARLAVPCSTQQSMTVSEDGRQVWSYAPTDTRCEKNLAMTLCHWQ